jgi:hypothetical protein
MNHPICLLVSPVSFAPVSFEYLSGPITGICGDGEPVAKATVHSPIGSWDIGGSGNKRMPRSGCSGVPIH